MDIQRPSIAFFKLHPPALALLPLVSERNRVFELTVIVQGVGCFRKTVSVDVFGFKPSQCDGNILASDRFEIGARALLDLGPKQLVFPMGQQRDINARTRHIAQKIVCRFKVIVARRRGKPAKRHAALHVEIERGDDRTLRPFERQIFHFVAAPGRADHSGRSPETVSDHLVCSFVVQRSQPFECAFSVVALRIEVKADIGRIKVRHLGFKRRQFFQAPCMVAALVGAKDIGQGKAVAERLTWRDFGLERFKQRLPERARLVAPAIPARAQGRKQFLRFHCRKIRHGLCTLVYLCSERKARRCSEQGNKKLGATHDHNYLDKTEQYRRG